MQDGLGKTRGARREVDGGLVGVGDGDLRRPGRGGGDEFSVAFCEGRHVDAHVDEQLHPGDLSEDAGYAVDELGTEHDGVGVGQVQAVGDLLGGVAVVHGHRQGASLEDTEIYRQPLETVGEQYGHLLALAEPPSEE
ncbi:MAG: hypothetical protein BWY79_00948 [Actinobacteria bacterium ADurb.Bin444]|nr:MAG: hypothetical protein BWY79_00948 [Actinobacteria bacterium ADurb.Bin444]